MAEAAIRHQLDAEELPAAVLVEVEMAGEVALLAVLLLDDELDSQAALDLLAQYSLDRLENAGGGDLEEGAAGDAVRVFYQSLEFKLGDSVSQLLDAADETAGAGQAELADQFVGPGLGVDLGNDFWCR